jgi:hypothetical protein
VRWDRVVVGLLLTAAGMGWLVDAQGASVPWRYAPSAALIVVGAVLLLSLAGGRGRGGLVGIGVVMLVLAGAVGIGAGRFAGPVGDRTIAPSTADWPISTTLTAGNVVVDLTRIPPLATGRLDVHVGAGRVVVRVPERAAVRVEAAVVVGSVALDGEKLQEGFDLHWVDPQVGDVPVTVAVDIGAGDVEVHRARS